MEQRDPHELIRRTHPGLERRETLRQALCHPPCEGCVPRAHPLPKRGGEGWGTRRTNLKQMEALYGITNHRLDAREARLVLAALNGARTNLKQMEACVAKVAQVSKSARPGAPRVSDKKGKRTRISNTARSGAPAGSVKTLVRKSARRRAKVGVEA
jgi:hypothetical protein